MVGDVKEATSLTLIPEETAFLAVDEQLLRYASTVLHLH